MAKAHGTQKNPVRLLIGVAIIVFGVLLLLNGISGVRDNRQRLFAPDGFIEIEVVETAEDRQRGLSGREMIGDDQGMLFVFDTVSDANCFWMKDMLISIDMIWLDQDKRVVSVRPDVSPDTFPQTFCPEGAAQYGLELGSGRAEVFGIRIGELLRF